MGRLWMWLLVLVVATGAVLAAVPKVGIVVAYIPSDDNAVTAVQVIKRLKDLRTQSGSNVSFTAYYYDRPDEQALCHKLKIEKQDLPFVGVVRLNAAGDPVEVLNRLPHVQDVGAADTAFAKVQAKLGVAPPARTPSPSASPQAAASGEPEREIINEKDRSKLVLIPAGAFTMGSDEHDADKPAHQVTLQAYYIGKYDVTMAQFSHFVSASGYKVEGTWNAENWGRETPVRGVTWKDAVAYCQWAGVRLPTEAEWEKAARGTDGRKYPWGNDWDPNRCRNNCAGFMPGAARVGAYPSGASPYGCMDMAGNAMQWTSSLFRPYPYDATDGREDPSGAGERLARGSYFRMTEPDNYCVYRRFPGLSNRSGSLISFRVAKTP